MKLSRASFLILSVILLSSCKEQDSGSEIGSVPSPGNQTRAGLVPIGWDPGLKTPRAVGASLDKTMEPFSVCPAEGGNCDALPPGGGFYTLVLGSDYVNAQQKVDARGCRPSPPSTPLQNRVRMARFGDPKIKEFEGILCPYLFEWTRDHERLIANMSIDSSGFGHDLTPNIYIGLQQNIPTGHVKGGLNFADTSAAPLLNDIQEVSFAYRANVCDPRRDGWFFGRGVFIIEAYNPQYPGTDGSKGRGMQLSINFFEYLRGVNRADVGGAMVDGVKSQNAMASHNEHWENTWQMNGSDFPQFVTVGSQYKLRADPSCNAFAVGDWTEVRIKLKELLRHLSQTVPEFPKDPNFWNGARFTGGTHGGVEFWGQGHVNFQLKNHVMWKKPGAGPIAQGPSGDVPVGAPSADTSNLLGLPCNANKNAAGKSATVADKTLVCRENGNPTTGFAWEVLDPNNPIGLQCNAGGNAAYRTGVAGLTCRPFSGSPTGWRWLK